MDTIASGTRVRLSGGYNGEPLYLGGRPALLGSIVRFIPGGAAQPAAVVKLDSPVTADGATAQFVVLWLRYDDARWRSRETVHVELCDFEPEPKPEAVRRAGRWLESHATFEVLPDAARPMNESASKRRALPFLLVGFLIILAASFCTSGAVMRPILDASGHPILVDGFDYPQQEIDAAATLRANLPAYLCALVGIGFIARATVIRFCSPKDRNETL